MQVVFGVNLVDYCPVNIDQFDSFSPKKFCISISDHFIYVWFFEFL